MPELFLAQTTWAKENRTFLTLKDPFGKRRFIYEAGTAFRSVPGQLYLKPFGYMSIALVAPSNLDIIRFEERHFLEEDSFESVIMLGVVPDSDKYIEDYGGLLTATYDMQGKLQQPICTDFGLLRNTDRQRLLEYGHLSVRDLPEKINFKRLARKIVHQASGKNFNNPQLQA